MPQSNFELLEAFLETTSDLKTDIERMKFYVSNIGAYITTNVTYPLPIFLKKLYRKLQIMTQIAQTNGEDYTQEFLEIKMKLRNCSEFIDKFYKTAEIMANKLMEDYLQPEKAEEGIGYKKRREIVSLLNKLRQGKGWGDILFSQDKTIAASPFTETIRQFALTWEAIEPNIKDKFKQDPIQFEQYEFNIRDTDKNQLAKILNPDQQAFLIALELGQISNDGVWYDLALGRLSSIFSSLPPRHQKDILKTLHPTALDKGVLSFDINAVKAEVIKLVLLKLYHETLSGPKQSPVAWISSARTMAEMIDITHSQIGAYLNCDDRRWSLTLNQIWLNAALALGYQIQAIEQHLPKIIDAVTSEQLGRLILAIADEMRNEHKDVTTQYHGGAQPTATPGEMLYLLSSGAHISVDESTGFLIFERSQQTKELDTAVKTTKMTERRRSHSVSGGEHFATQLVRQNFFQAPQSSEAIRAKKSEKLWEKPATFIKD